MNSAFVYLCIHIKDLKKRIGIREVGEKYENDYMEESGWRQYNHILIF